MSSSRANLASVEKSSRWSPAEWETRVTLAAFYRLVARYRMTDLIYTHISARVPGVKDTPRSTSPERADWKVRKLSAGSVCAPSIKSAVMPSDITRTTWQNFIIPS